MVSTILKG